MTIRTETLTAPVKTSATGRPTAARWTVLAALALAALAAAFDAHSTASLRQLREADTDPLRASLDDAVATALGLPPELGAAARAEFAVEPSVQG